MDMLARVFELNQYCTDPEKLAARAALFGHVDDIMNETKPKKKKGSKK
jgi:hypothetical protein